MDDSGDQEFPNRAPRYRGVGEELVQDATPVPQSPFGVGLGDGRGGVPVAEGGVAQRFERVYWAEGKLIHSQRE